MQCQDCVSHTSGMRIGVIDLGTNSIRFAIYEFGSLKGPKACIFKQKIMLRPGRGVFTSGMLQAQVMSRIKIAMGEFHRQASERHCDLLEAFATSALREAKNSKTLIASVYKLTKIRIKVISGEREAELIARGILYNEPSLIGEFALIDIGGGSTEINLCRGKKVIASMSLKLGSVRLQQLFPSGKKISHMRRYIRRHLHRHEKTLTKIHVTRAIGSSGSIRALARVIAKSVPRLYVPLRLRSETKSHFTRSALSHFTELLTPLSPLEIGRIPGLEPRRADLILPAAVLLEELILFLGIDQVQTTEYSLRDGLVLEVIENFKSKI